jgi:RimJ/RimL family protein N-acetyltransferase
VDRQPVLEGDLVRLRPLTDDDHDALFAISSDPLLWEQHPAKVRATPEGFRQWFADAMASGGALVVGDRSDGRVIGTSRYDRYDPEERTVEIGWTFLDRRLWGGPWNAAMKALMLEHAFHSVDAVLFRVHSGNLRSQRAVLKLGAEHVAVEPFDGEGDAYVYRLTPEAAARSPR